MNWSFSLLTMLSMFLTSEFAFAAVQTCDALFAQPAARGSKPINVGSRARNLLARIEKIRDIKPLPDPMAPRNRWRSHDRDLAFRLAKYLDARGNKTDFEILESIISVIELTKGNHQTSLFSDTEIYYPRLRPRTHLFQEDHWNFENLTEYFFASSSKLRITKQRDLKFVQLVLAVAGERHPHLQELDRVLTEADFRWHAANLESQPDLRRDLIRWREGASLESRRDQLLGLIKSQRAEVQAALAPAASFLKTSRSYFDLLILGRYIERVIRFGLDDARLVPESLRTIQLTHWKAIEEGLAFGNAEFWSEFLLSTSHDTARKAFVYRALQGMPAMDSSAGFVSAYKRSFGALVLRTPDQPAPRRFESDIHIFTVFGREGLDELLSNQTYPKGFVEDPRVVHIVASWNKKLGELDMYIAKSLPLSGPEDTMLSAMPELAPLVDLGIETLRNRGTVSEGQLQNHRLREYSAMAVRTTFIVAMKPGGFGSESLVALGRIFDGSPRFVQWPDRSEIIELGGEKTFIEHDYPNLILPERKSGGELYELGRLLTTNLASPNSRFGVVSFFADVFDNSGARGGAYMDGGPAARKMNEGMGAKVFAAPEALGLSPEDKPIWVLRAPVEQIRRDHLPSDFEAIHLNENLKSN